MTRENSRWCSLTSQCTSSVNSLCTESLRCNYANGSNTGKVIDDTETSYHRNWAQIWWY